MVQERRLPVMQSTTRFTTPLGGLPGSASRRGARPSTLEDGYRHVCQHDPGTDARKCHWWVACLCRSGCQPVQQHHKPECMGKIRLDASTSCFHVPPSCATTALPRVEDGLQETPCPRILNPETRSVVGDRKRPRLLRLLSLSRIFPQWDPNIE